MYEISFICIFEEIFIQFAYNNGIYNLNYAKR